MGYLKKYLFLLILLTTGIAAFIRGIFFLDPDFGWHLKMGQLILQKGIPLIDPFSYTMPSYHFVDHEWLANILISVGYKSIGIYGLALIFALIFVLALFLAVPKKFKNYSFLPLVLAGGLMLGFTGIRTQVITWFFLALLLRIILDENLWKKWKLFIPILFLPWVNLHAGFAIGIALLLVVFIFKSLQNKKFELGFFGVFLASLLITFLNPYGPRIWWEVWQQVSDTGLRWTISEWMPAIFYADIALLILFALSVFLVFRYKAKLGGMKVLVYLFLLLMAFSSLRHVPLWALSAVFITSEAIKLLTSEVSKNKAAVLRLKKLNKILFVAILLVFLFEISTSLIAALNLSEQNYYPLKAVNYLSKQNLADGNLFAAYNYGGYLIWKLPSKKVFIDGRMPSWRRSGIFPKESNYAFKDYIKMVSNGNYFKQMLKKYNIRYILLPAQPVNRKVPSTVIKLINLLQKLTLFKTNTAVIDGDLTKMNYKKIYNDGRFVIYEI